jgi:DNA-binding NarL/FixJ family response regulator
MSVYVGFKMAGGTLMNEIRVIEELLAGASNPEIASATGLTIDRVKKIISSLYQRYGLRGQQGKRIKLAIIMGTKGIKWS